MIINAKSITNLNEIKIRKDLGATTFELQLYRDFTLPNAIETILGVIKEAGLYCNVVHTPLPLEGGGEIAVQHLCGPSKVNILKSFELAEELYKMQSKVDGINYIGVVIHNVMALDEMKSYSMLEEVEENIQYILDKFPNCELLIENTMMVKSAANKFINVTNGSLLDTVEVVKYLRDRFKTNRIKSVIDICHTISSIRTLRRCFDEDKTVGLKNIRLFDIFKASEGVLGLIHLNNSEGLGNFSSYHGTPFTKSDEDMRLLTEIADLYKRFANDCPVTIEVREDDYKYPVNYTMTRDNWLSYFDVGVNAKISRLYCANCRHLVESDVIEIEELFSIDNKEVYITQKNVVCVECGEKVETDTFKNYNANKLAEYVLSKAK